MLPLLGGTLLLATQVASKAAIAHYMVNFLSRILWHILRRIDS